VAARLGLDELRVELTRVQPPLCYWTVYRSPVLGLVTLKAFFSAAAYAAYAAQLHDAEITLLPDLNAIVWRYPFDPALPGLARCLDGSWIAGLLGRSAELTAEPRAYNPEIGALLAYRTAAGHAVAYAKVTPTQLCGDIHLAMDRLWRARLFRTARPLAYRADAGVMLQAPVPGRALMGNRNREIFGALVDAAAEMASALHAADLPFGPPRLLPDLLARLEAGLADLAHTAPALYPTLQRLLGQIERHSRLAKQQPLAPSHGDFKYDQLLEHHGQFSLIDFELFCQAEPALDLGAFCAYLPPSRPRDWSDSTAAEVLRARFLAGVAGELDLERVAVFEATMLGLRALSHVWSFQRGWQERAAMLLGLAFERLVDPLPQQFATQPTPS
jgi:hypothetical protein